MGTILIVQMIPTLVFLLLGGIAADRLPRRVVLFWSDAGRAVVVLLIAVLSWIHLIQLWHLFALGFTFGVVSAFFQPAFQAVPPQLVPVDDLPSANALTQLSLQVGRLLGPIVGAICISVGGPASAFGFDGLTFVISALALLSMRGPLLPHHPAEKAGSSVQGATTGSQGDKARQRLREIIEDLREGMSYITRSTWLLVTILVPAVGSFGSAGPLAVALPKLVHDVYGAGVWLLGAFGTAGGLGWIGATFFVGQVHLRKRGLVAFAFYSLASFALLLLGLPLPHPSEPVVALVAGMLYGFGTGTLQTIWVTLLHELVPNDKLGRVSSIDLLGSLSLLPISYLVVGILADQLGPAWVFLAGGILKLVLNGFALSLRDIRRLA
jgi:MFS family permease